jgi:hypothetical protein
MVTLTKALKDLADKENANSEIDSIISRDNLLPRNC